MPSTALISSFLTLLGALMLLTTVLTYFCTSEVFAPEPLSSDQQLTLPPRRKQDKTRHKEAKRLEKDICRQPGVQPGCSQVLVSSSTTNLCNSPRIPALEHYLSTLVTLYYCLPLFINFHTSKDFKGWHHSDSTINTEPVLYTPKASVSTTLPPVLSHHLMNI